VSLLGHQTSGKDYPAQVGAREICSPTNVAGFGKPPAKGSGASALDAASQSSELYSFEPEALTAAGAAAGEHLRRLIDLTRRALFAQATLIEQRGAFTSKSTEPDEARAALGHAIASAFEGIARQVEAGVPAVRRRCRARFRQRGCLCEVLVVERVEALQRE
jgi:hypothetical protein